MDPTRPGNDEAPTPEGEERDEAVPEVVLRDEGSVDYAQIEPAPSWATDREFASTMDRWMVEIFNAKLRQR